jgi:16S rRNA (cytosine1402-N4)-methyltransferase
MQQTKNNHVPVLLNPVLQYLAPKEGDSYLDLTAGYGGHARAVLAQTHAPQLATLVDRDLHAIAALELIANEGARIIQKDFFSASNELLETGQQFDMILADLGISSPHLDNPERGFAFATDGPLDMRMDQSQALTAEMMVNTYDTAELQRIIRTYGEEPHASRIAQAIVIARPITTTSQLAEVVKRAIPRKGYSKTHPATRTFQAIRIAVNDELELLQKSLPLWFDLLAPGGRITVISFHSLEDRLVKQAFKDNAGDRYDTIAASLTKRPVVADETELAFNPRARSAKLRAAVKK